MLDGHFTDLLFPSFKNSLKIKCRNFWEREEKGFHNTLQDLKSGTSDIIRDMHEFTILSSKTALCHTRKKISKLLGVSVIEMIVKF